MEKLQNEMTTKEQKQALIYFNEWIKKGNATIEQANPINQNCYISNSDVWGLYFPNTQIILNNSFKHHYNFLCVSKNNYNVLGVVYALKSEFYNENGKPKGLLTTYIFDPFNGLFDSIEYQNLYIDIKNTIINKSLEIDTLKSFRILNKKTGEAFKEYNKNFLYNEFFKSWNDTPNKTQDKKPLFNVQYNYTLNCIYRIDVIMGNFYANLFVESYQKKTIDEFAPDEIYKLIKIELIKRNSEIEQYKKTFENLQKVYKEFKKINSEYKSKLNELTQNNKVLNCSCEFEHMKKSTF